MIVESHKYTFLIPGTLISTVLIGNENEFKK